MDLIKIDIPYSHIECRRMGEIDYDCPHSTHGHQCFVLGYDQHEWLIKNSPNQFYSLFTTLEPISVDFYGLKSFNYCFNHQLYTYKDVALLYKLTWF